MESAKTTGIRFMMLLLISYSSEALSQLNVGVGYFGETGVYPGAVIELERESFHSSRFSTPFRADLGFYSHPRSHHALFLDVHQGIRRSFNSGFMIESSIGVGVMLTFMPETVYMVDDAGNVSTTSKMQHPDLMPSVTLGIGYDLNRDPEKRDLIWIRPKIFWQYPYNSMALPHLALQVGYTHTIK
jgi:hypothetical protein